MRLSTMILPSPLLALVFAALLSVAMPAMGQEAQPAAPTGGQPAPEVPTTAPTAASDVAPATSASAASPSDAGDGIAASESTGVAPILPHDLSPWGMFMQADIVVKAVMIGLAFASLVTWTVWLAKSLELLGARARAQHAGEIVIRARSLREALSALAGKGGPVPLFVQAAHQEAELSEAALDHVDGTGLKERVSSRLSRIEAQASRRMTRGTGLLATIGSTAPFVGLFGTVWGIMNAFIGISESQTTNLAVVAPGIAEALLATAIGLVAAIPAVVIYNIFARSIAGYRQVLADASAGVERLVSRDLDYRGAPLRKLAAE